LLVLLRQQVSIDAVEAVQSPLLAPNSRVGTAMVVLGITHRPGIEDLQVRWDVISESMECSFSLVVF